MADGDVWYRCVLYPGMWCRGSLQTQGHTGCMDEPLVRNAGLEPAQDEQPAAGGIVGGDDRDPAAGR